MKPSRLRSTSTARRWVTCSSSGPSILGDRAQVEFADEGERRGAAVGVLDMDREGRVRVLLRAHGYGGPPRNASSLIAEETQPSPWRACLQVSPL